MSTQQRTARNSNTRQAKNFPYGFVIIVSTMAIFILALIFAPNPAKKPKVKKVPLVEVVSVKKGDVAFEIETQGSVSPRTETTLVSEVSGQIKKVSPKFVVGGFFSKGEEILTIDPISYEVALLQAQARLDSAKARLIEEEARSKQAIKEWKLTGRSLKKAPILALRKPQLQLAKADVKAAEADVKNAQIKLQRTKIVAPYDAMIKSKLVDVGQYVSMGSQLAVSFAVDYAEIRLPIKEADLPYIDVPQIGRYMDRDEKTKQANAMGSQVLLAFKQNGKIKQWQTHIIRSEGVVDQTSRVNYVVAQIDDPYGLLSSEIDHPIIPIGSFVRARISGSSLKGIISVPRIALRGANSLYLMDEDNTLKVVDVQIIRSDRDNIYVAEGLSENSQIILTKLPTAVAGMKLRTTALSEPKRSQVEGEN